MVLPHTTPVDTMSPQATWVSISEASKQLGVGQTTLRKWKRSEAGFLIEGKHWKKGMNQNSPVCYNLTECRTALE